MATRTSGERKTMNYFKLLKLDVTENDQSVIESTIQKRIQEWQRAGKMQFLKYKDDLRAVMLDPDARREEAEIYRSILDAEKAGIIGRIHVYLSMGAIDSIQFDRLVKDLKLVSSRDYVRELLDQEKTAFIDFAKEFGVERIETVKELMDAQMLLESERETIREVMGEQENLLTFLSVSLSTGIARSDNTNKPITPNSSIEDLSRKLDELHELCESQDKSHKDNRYVTIERIRKALIKPLKSEGSLRFYADYWKLFPLYERVRYYTEKEYTAQLKWASTQGCNPKNARLFLRYCYSAKDIPILEQAAKEYLSCPVCENFYDRKQHKGKCPHCGSDSSWVCKVCQTANAKGEVCKKCKISRQSYENYLTLTEQIKMLLTSGQYASAGSKIVEAGLYRNIITYLDGRSDRKSEIYYYKEWIDAEMSYTNLKNQFTDLKFDPAASMKAAQDFLHRFDTADSIAEIHSRVELVRSLMREYQDAYRCSCGQLIKSRATQVCPKCKRNLVEICWNCGATVATLQSADCPRCHANTAMQEVFSEEIGRCTAMINAESFEADLVGSAVNALKTKYQVQSVDHSVIADQIDSLERELRTFTEAYQQYVLKIREQIRKKSYYSAQTLLNALKLQMPSYPTDQLERPIRTNLKKIEKLLQSAQNSADKAAAIRSAEQCMQICRDCADAEQIIRSHPPQKPADLTATLLNDQVELHWNYPADGIDTVFTVLRKSGSRPTSVRDGEILTDQLRVCSFVDRQISPAVRYFYAVYATQKFAGDAVVMYSDLERTEKETMSLPDVSAVDQLIEDGAGISLRWTPPSGVHSVLVVKKPGTVPPYALSDGMTVPSVGRTGFDDAVTKNEPFSYRIICRYMVDGIPRDSKGICYTAKKPIFPTAPTNRSVTEQSACNYLVKLTGGADGEVQFYAAPRQHSNPPRRAARVVDFAMLCPEFTPIRFNHLEEKSYQLTVAANSYQWVYPVIANDTLFAVGEPFLLNTIVGMDEIETVVRGSSVKIQGQISPKVRNMIAVVDSEGYCEELREGVARRVFAREQIQKESCLSLTLSPGKYYVTMFAEFEQDGHRTYSKAIRVPEIVIGERIILKYSMRYTVSTNKSYDAKISFEISGEDAVRFGAGNTLPDLVLVQGSPRPMTAADGMEVARIRSVTMKKSFLHGKTLSAQVTVQIPKSERAKNKLSLFWVDSREGTIQLKEI